MKRISTLWAFLVVLTLVLIAGSWYLVTSSRVVDAPEPPEFSNSQALPEPQDVPVERSSREVTLFVGNVATGTLTRKIFDIEDDQELLTQITQTVIALLGPNSGDRNDAIPEGTKLLSVFMTSTGVVYLNLSRHIQDLHIGGLSAELTTVTSLVNTMLFNFQAITQIQLLVEGAEIETLAGHVDCRKPFSKMFLLDS